jgi:hypothetical protein
MRMDEEGKIWHPANTQEQTKEILNKISNNLTKFAAAFAKQTNIPPDECELVVDAEQTEKGFRLKYYFKRKDIIVTGKFTL